MALILRFFLNVFQALSTPWLELIFLGETLLMLVSVVSLLTSTQQVVGGLVEHEARSKQEYASLQALAAVGRNMAQAQLVALRELQQKEVISRALAKASGYDVSSGEMGPPSKTTTYTVATDSPADQLFYSMTANSAAAQIQ
jgi:hypothetical protein